MLRFSSYGRANTLPRIADQRKLSRAFRLVLAQTGKPLRLLTIRRTAARGHRSDGACGTRETVPCCPIGCQARLPSTPDRMLGRQGWLLRRGWGVPCGKEKRKCERLHRNSPTSRYATRLNRSSYCHFAVLLICCACAIHSNALQQRENQKGTGQAFHFCQCQYYKTPKSEIIHCTHP